MKEMNHVINSFFKDHKTTKLYTYSEFMELWENNITNAIVEELDDQGKIYHEYRKLNMHRNNRIQKIFKPNEEIVNKIKQINNPQTWLVITEDWCGDSAQNLPYFIKYTEFNPNISVRIILRDQNLDVIDSYLKEGNPRSIPKIIGFDENGNQLFIWGPRPKFAQDLVLQLKSKGYSKEEFNKELHLWYGRNRGKELESEILKLVSSLVSKK